MRADAVGFKIGEHDAKDTARAQEIARIMNDVATDFSATRTYELAGKTLGIVGLGTIGKKVARRAVAARAPT